MSDGEQTAFSLGYWVYAHQKQVRWLQLGALGTACLIIWGINTWQGIRYLVNRPVDMEVQRSFLATDISFSSLARPQALRVLSAEAIRHDATHVDVVALVKNQNTVFASHEVMGQFTVAGVKQAPVTFFTNVDETQYVPQLSISYTGTSVPEATFSILSTDWFRIHGTPLQDKWIVSDVSYEAIALVQSDIDLKRQVKSTILNASAYDFQQVRVTVVLLQNDVVVGVASTLTDEFSSLESKNYSFTWSQDLSLSAIPHIEVHVDRSDPNQIGSPGN